MNSSIRAAASLAAIVTLMIISGCQQSSTAAKKAATTPASEAPASPTTLRWVSPAAKARANIYVPVKLTADLSKLSEHQRAMLKKLIEAAKVMDHLYWLQTYGEPARLLKRVASASAQNFVRINYGPWDRLNGDKPFLTGIGTKPLGANFYPKDMTRKEFEHADLPGKRGLYSVLQRNSKGKLTLVPYHTRYADELQHAATILRDAAKLADYPPFANYLLMRADALVSDHYRPSDFAWMNMKKNPIELVIGPIETYEDQLFGYRAAYEAYVLIKDQAWSARLARFASFLPALQRGLPVPERFKAEKPGTDSDLNAYDVIYYAGNANAGAKTIAINLPNDEQVQLKKGTRRLQLKNAMRAKFDQILVPIAQVLIAPDQRQHVKFYAFFANTMFHEVAHGLGIKQTLDGKGTVRQALKETASALEEGKADILGLYMVTKLFEKGELKQGQLLDYYTTFLASTFRSVRFGASDAHGKANMLRFNYFARLKAFSRDAKTGTYRVNLTQFKHAMEGLSHDLLLVQGNGDYARAKQWLAKDGVIGAQLQTDLERLKQAKIPVDVVFEQGDKILGL